MMMLVGTVCATRRTLLLVLLCVVIVLTGTADAQFATTMVPTTTPFFTTMTPTKAPFSTTMTTTTTPYYTTTEPSGSRWCAQCVYVARSAMNDGLNDAKSSFATDLRWQKYMDRKIYDACDASLGVHRDECMQFIENLVGILGVSMLDYHNMPRTACTKIRACPQIGGGI